MFYSATFPNASLKLPLSNQKQPPVNSQKALGASMSLKSQDSLSLEKTGVKAQSSVRFGGGDINIIKPSSAIQGALIKGNIQSNKITGVKIGDSYKTYGQYNAFLSPEINIFKISRGSTSKGSADIDAIKREIREPLMAQIRNIEDLFTRRKSLNLERAQQNLEWAMNAPSGEDLKHYLLKAEQKFDSAVREPADFESGITAQVGLIQTFILLGKKAEAQKMRYEMLLTLATSETALKEAALKAAENPQSKEAMIKDLIYLQKNGGAAGNKNIYGANQYLKSPEITRNFFVERLNCKDLSNLYIWGVDHLKKYDLRGVNFSHSDLSQLDLAGQDLSQTILRGANLKKANLEKANLQDAVIDEQTDLTEASLAYAKNARSVLLKPSDDPSVIGPNLCMFRTKKISGTEFSGLNLDNLVYRACDYPGIPVFKNISLQRALIDLRWTSGAKFDFSNSDLTNAFIDSGTSLQMGDAGGVVAPDFKDAKLINAKFFGEMLLYPKFNGTTLINTPLPRRIISPDFTNAVIKSDSYSPYPIVYNAIFDNTEVVSNLWPGYNPTIRNMSPEKLKVWASSSNIFGLHYITTPDNTSRTSFFHSFYDPVHKGIRHTFRDGTWVSENVVSHGNDNPAFMSSIQWLNASEYRKSKEEEEQAKKEESCVLM